MINQRKIGIALTYLALVCNSVINILFTPYLLRTLGPTEYGLYQIINSFAAYLLIADLGTGTLMTRYLSKYMAINDKKGQENYIAIGLLITAACSIIIILLGVLLYSGIDNLYKDSLNTIEIVKAKKLYIILIANITISVFSRAFYGIVVAYEKYIITKSLNLAIILLKVLFLIILLNLGLDSVAIVLTDLILTIMNLITLIFFCFHVLKIKVKLYSFDKVLIWDSLTFASAIFLQTIVVQVNNNVDKVMLGAMTDTLTVALYSIGMIIFTSYNIIANAVGSVYLPYVTRTVFQGADNEKLTDIVIAPGRFNFIVCGTILAVFALFGNDFIILWVGAEYKMAWTIALILMVPYTIPFIQIVTGSILDAKNKRLFRSVIIVIIAGLNILLTYILVKKIGYIGAPIATAIAVFLGHGVLINIYYQKVIGLNIKRIFLSVFKGTLPSLLGACILSSPFLLIERTNWFIFISECLCFLIFFIIIQYFFGFNHSEKKYVNTALKKVVKKFRAGLS